MESFVQGLYTGREVGVKSVAVTFARRANELRNSIGISVSNLNEWSVEKVRTDDANGIIIPERQIVLGSYIYLAVRATPMRYAVSRFALAEWLQYEDGVAVEGEEGVLPAAVVQTVAALLPDREIVVRRRGATTQPVEDPDLILPIPKKTITISGVPRQEHAS